MRQSDISRLTKGSAGTSGFTFVSVAVGFVLGVLLGILLSRLPKNLSKLILPILSIFNTIPGVVFVGLLFLVLGMQPITVLIALSIYATFPILKNTYAGLSSVEGQYIEAAKGCGMSPVQCLVRVELPWRCPPSLADCACPPSTPSAGRCWPL